MRAACAGYGALKGASDGVGVGAEGDTAVEFGVDGEEVAREAFRVRVVSVVRVGKDDGVHDGADTVVDTEAGFDPGVEGEEHGVLGEEADAFG